MEEISIALSQMQPFKAPGPDGFAACFYQKYCSIVGDEVSRTVLNFLNFGIFDEKLNSTYIALIRKSKNPSKVSDYRPIS